MLLAELVPQVDPIKDFWDYLNTFAGLGGAAAGVVAIWIALRAQRTADRAVTEERRRAFELEVLRDLAEALDNNLAGEVYHNPTSLRRYALRLDLLSDRLPTWDRVLAISNSASLAAVSELVAEHQRAVAEAAALDLEINEEAETFRQQRDAFIDSPATSEFTLQTQEGEHTAKTVRLGKIQQAAAARVNRTWLAAIADLKARLSHDVQQAALSRIEARPGPAGFRYWWKYKSV